MFSPQEEQLLERYVTSARANIFAVKNMGGMTGAAYARYSRAKGGFREVLLREFLTEEWVIDPKHADDLIQRILIAYGDDSVGELEGAHVSFERISMVATKDIEDRRIGGSPIEQSTRYVLYDQKDEDGKYLYYRGPEVMESSFSPQYVETMDFIFGTYSELVEPLKAYLQGLKPMGEAEYDVTGEGVKRKLQDLTEEGHLKSFRMTYNADLRSKACDILRLLLPLATLTNVGVAGNGRYFQGLLSFLRTSDLRESNAIADGARTALNEVIPQYVRREGADEYRARVNRHMYQLAWQLFGSRYPRIPRYLPSVELMDRGETFLETHIKNGTPVKKALSEVEDICTIAAMLYPYTNLSLSELRSEVWRMDFETKEHIIRTYIGDRGTRRDRPGRAIEDGYPYTFDLVTNFGVYKDLERHRMLTQQRQLFTTNLGFQVLPELEAIGKADLALQCAARADDLFNAMDRRSSSVLAQYAVLHGHYVRWMIGCNDRALMHLTELRSTPQGHPNYRLVAQDMHDLVTARSRWRGEAMKFVDHEDYYWSRAESEAKQRVKEAKLDDKLSKV